MKKIILASLLLTQALLPATAWCAIEITPDSKVTSNITATVKSQSPFEVTDMNDGWPSLMELEQPPTTSWGAPFEGQLQLKIKIPAPSTSFQVSLSATPTLSSASKQFQSVEVRMQSLVSGSSAQLIPLTPNKLTLSYHGSASIIGWNTAHYMLKVSAQPPSGKPQNLGGTYTGKLSMIFEPVSVAVSP